MSENPKLGLCVTVVLTLVSCSSARLTTGEAIDKLFQEYTQPNVPGAAVLVVKNDKILHKRCYGLADLEHRKPVTSTTNFRLASVTKQFTALAVLKLAEENRLSLDDYISKYFPHLPTPTREIRIRHLLNHTSGIVDYESLIPDSQTVQVIDKDVLALLENADSVYFPAGTKLQYSNSAYALLALIVEAVSCSSFSDFLQEHIFAPAGMNHSLARRDGMTVANRAFGYTRTDSAFVFADQSVTSAVLGDGGIYSSVDDMFRWDQVLNSERVFSRASLDQIFSPSVRVDSVESYGFGWYVADYKGIHSVYHTGTTRGFRNAIIRLPDRSFTVVILTNRNEGNPIDIARKIIDLYFLTPASSKDHSP